MKLPLHLVSLVFALSTASANTDSIQLRVKPERERLFRQRDAEIVFRIDLEGVKARSTERRTPINLALVLDRSGSMQGAKLEKARQAACMAIDQLTERDTVSLVTYDDETQVVISQQRVEDAEKLKREVRRIESGGSTALHAGVKRGAEELRRYVESKDINRIILLSDGIANVGPSSPRELARLGRELKERGAGVTTVGLGDDYNENLMVALAEASAANYYYVKDTETLPKIFAEELGQIKSIVARNLRIIIEVPAGVEPIEVIGCPEIQFRGRKAEIALGEFYGAQKRHYLVRCRANDPSSAQLDLGQIQLAYHDELRNAAASQEEAARVEVTEDKDAAEKSLHEDVVVDATVASNNAARDQALELQDAGKTDEAAKVLAGQARMNAALAPKVKSGRLKEESESLQQYSDRLGSGAKFNTGERKGFQYENYQQKKQR